MLCLEVIEIKGSVELIHIPAVVELVDNNQEIVKVLNDPLLNGVFGCHIGERAFDDRFETRATV